MSSATSRWRRRVAEAEDLADMERRSGRLLAVTYNYSGYPMVRRARAIVDSGTLGPLRLVEVEYAQEWLTRPVERTGNRQAAWRSDPARAGLGGALGDIGVHAYHLARFVGGLAPQALLADLAAFGAGRALDDNAHVLLRWSGGARGMLWASQVAPGCENALRLRLFGADGGLDWSLEQPDRLAVTRYGQSTQVLERSDQPARDDAETGSMPAGHPQTFVEAFAQLYADMAEQIAARGGGREPKPGLLPTVEDGLEGVRFIAAAVESNRRGGVWLDRAAWGG